MRKQKMKKNNDELMPCPFNHNDMCANVRTHVPDFVMASEIMGLIGDGLKYRNTRHQPEQPSGDMPDEIYAMPNDYYVSAGDYDEDFLEGSTKYIRAALASQTQVDVVIQKLKDLVPHCEYDHGEDFALGMDWCISRFEDELKSPKPTTDLLNEIITVLQYISDAEDDIKNKHDLPLLLSYIKTTLSPLKNKLYDIVNGDDKPTTDFASDIDVGTKPTDEKRVMDLMVEALKDCRGGYCYIRDYKTPTEKSGIGYERCINKADKALAEFKKLGGE